MKSVLMLGAGLMQKPAIKAIKALGYKAVVIDADKNAVAIKDADEFVNIDLKDTEAIIALANTLNKDEGLAGVFTSGTDFSYNVARVAAQLGLKGHTVEAALNASQKTLMRLAFLKHNVPSPQFCSITDSNIDPLKALPNSSYPLVIKPTLNMGARGCRIIRNAAEAKASIASAISFSRNKEAILEEYMDGAEFSLDSVVYKDTLTITGFADRHIYYPPYFIEMGHTMPTTLETDSQKKVIEVFAKGIRALGLTEGAAKGDMKLTSKGAFVGEIAARLSGGYMSGWTYPYASNFDLTLELVKIACGLPPDLLLEKRVPLGMTVAGFTLYEVPCVEVSAERAWLSIPGKIKELQRLDVAFHMPFVEDVFIRTKQGESVDFPRNNVQKCGNLISKSRENSVSVAAANYAVCNIVLRLEPHNTATDNFLNGITEDTEEGFPPCAYDFGEKQKEIEAKLDKFTIKENENLCDFFEKEAFEVYSLPQVDYNKRNILKSLITYDELCPKHPAFSAKDAFRVLVRGGLQGLLYLSDSL